MEDLKVTTSRTLRDIAAREEIKCTSSLVQAFNETTGEEECLAMFMWLDLYVEVVSQSSPERFTPEQLHEFAELGKLKGSDNRTVNLVNRVFCCLLNWVQGRKSCSLCIILELESFLASVDAKILEEEADNLESLVHDLFDKVDPNKHPFNRSTYIARTGCLLTLEKALVALYRLKENKCGEQSMVLFQTTIKPRLNSISHVQNCFPIAYHAEITKKHSKMLFQENNCSFLAEVNKYTFLFLCQGLYFCQGLRGIDELESDLDIIINRMKEIGQRISDWRYPGIPDLYEISLSVSEALYRDDFTTYLACFENLGCWKRKWKTPHKSLMIKYALIMHLCLFFGEKTSENIQTSAMDFLKSLALANEYLRWRSEPVLYECLLYVITSIAVHCNHHKETCIDIHNQMHSCSDEVQRKTIKAVLGNQTFEEKVCNLQTIEAKEIYRSLFHIVKAHGGINQSFSTCLKNKETLIDNYKDDKFAMVPLIMGLHQEKHVKDFDFNLLMYDKVLVRNNEDLFNQDDYNQVANNVQRTMRIKTSITIHEIFKKQDEIAGSPIGENRVVLVVGNPGTGKTSLSKRLCYDWGNGNWGSMFTHVYLLPVRQLSRIGQGSHMDLVHAIVDLCYNPSRQHTCIEAIYDEVGDRLQEKTTLLILDGLDEGDSKAWELVHLSTKQACSLLLLSRPHNVQRIRDKADIEIECLEFSNKYLKSFIARELPQEDVEEFLQFLSQSSSIWEAARVPVNAQIICNMWTSSAKEELRTMKTMNLAWLYDQMVNYMWMRYAEKDDSKVREKELVFNSLEIIAFESFKKGKVEISESLVVEHSKTNSNTILRDAGFLLFTQEGQVFQFAHLTYHEYFVGRHLSNMLNSNRDREKRKAKRFICEHKYRDTSRIVFVFMIGLFCQDNDVEESLSCFKTLIDVFDEDPIEPIGWQHTFLKMRALDTFLTCCLDTSDLRSKDVQINEIVSHASRVVKDWMQIKWRVDSVYGMYHAHRHLWDRIIYDLGNMSNLHRAYSCFLEMIVSIEDIDWIYDEGNLDKIIKIAKCNPQVVRKMIPPNPNEIHTSDGASWYSWELWMCIYSKVNKECATDALSYLLKAHKRFGQSLYSHIIKIALVLLEVFPDDQEIKLIIHKLLQHSDSDLRSKAILQISKHSFQLGTDAETFAWSLQKRAMRDTEYNVKGTAFNWSRRSNQILIEEINELIEILGKEINNLRPDSHATNIRLLLKEAPHRENQLLPLLKGMCFHTNKYVREATMQVVWDIFSDSILARETLLSFVSCICQNGHWKTQYNLLPLLSILEADSKSLSTSVVEAIANRSSIYTNDRVKNIAVACNEAKEILSNNTMREIQTKFNTYASLTQVEILEHIHFRKLLTLETADDVAKMASIWIPNLDPLRAFLDVDDKGVAFPLLEDIAKEFRLPANVLGELAKRQYEYKRESDDRSWSNVRNFYAQIVSIICKQPADHLLNYYFESKDYHVIPNIAEKLLLTPVSLMEMSESEMKLTIMDSGSLLEKRVRVEDGHRLILHCKEFLKNYHNFKHIF